jgi:hypothetical protein
MRPTPAEQLRGIRQVLADVVAPQVTDAYPADVLAGALAALDLLADAWPEVPAFLRWDADETARVLALAGIEAPSPPTDVLDLDALEAHAVAVRGLLEEHMATVLDHPEARPVAVAHIRARSARYPLVARYPGAHGAHAPR